MKKRGMEVEHWDAALDCFHAQRVDSGTSDDWLKANHPDTVTERRDFYAKTPWSRFRASLNERVEQRRLRHKLGLTLWFSGLGVAASAAIALVMFWQGDVPVHSVESVTPQVRVKGSASVGVKSVASVPTLRVFSGEEELRSGAAIAADSVLRFRVNTFEYDHVLVFAVESDGRMHPYYPDTVNGQSVLVGQGKGIPLSGGVRLDGQVGRAHFVAVFSSKPLDWQTVKAQARRTYVNGDIVAMDSVMGLEGTGEAVVWFDTE